MTIDGFVLLTPILMLGVMALLGFVGCDRVFGLDRLPPAPGPDMVTAVPGDGRVDLSWAPYAAASQYVIKRRTGTEPQETIAFPLPTDTTYADTDVTNNVTYFYEITAKIGNTEVDPVVEVAATPTAVLGLTKFITAVTLGATSNAVTGFGGMAIRIGSTALAVKTLGRGYAPNNSGTHIVKIVNGATGADLPNASVSVTMTPATPGTFFYAPLASPVALAPGQLYYIVSEETAGGDLFHRNDTAIATTGVATVEGPAANQNNGPYTATAKPGFTIGPVDFQY